VNYADGLAAEAGLIDPQYTRGGRSDGHVLSAPIGSYRANRFGLHEMQGNVWEWCRDDFAMEEEVRPRDGDGLRIPTTQPAKGSIRGGSWSGDWLNSIVSNRMDYHQGNSDGDLGVRFARAVEP
jgi:formylglycine-generating enzyme required for sulfatase activity